MEVEGRVGDEAFGAGGVVFCDASDFELSGKEESAEAGGRGGRGEGAGRGGGRVVAGGKVVDVALEVVGVVGVSVRLVDRVV
jgi:hypothetical protein